MQDLTKITTPFGLLDEETRQALVYHGGPYELYTSLAGWKDFNKTHASVDSCSYRNVAIRVKPQPLTKPSIDWSHVHPDFKWLAVDEDGLAFLYAKKPKPDQVNWILDNIGTKYVEVEGFASYKKGTCDWKDSLVERPECV